jgi:two-component system CheB/CheR fusion protein
MSAQEKATSPCSPPAKLVGEEHLPRLTTSSAANNSRYEFPIVCVGASAGGLESLERMFAATPRDTGMAFIVVQHLSPDFKSLMDELLGRQTDIPIRKVEDGDAVEPNKIYLLPPKKHAIVSGGRLLLTDKDPHEPLSLPIDHFLRALAQEAGDKAVAVILSGSGSDGSRGIRNVHEAGGFVIAESEATAKFDGMPMSARETGLVNLVLRPEEVPAALLQHAASRRNGKPPAPMTTPTDQVDEGIELIFGLLNNEYGIDFSHYKATTVGRRIQRRLSMKQFDDINAYAEALQTDPNELNALYRDLLIGVTRFFRDPDAFTKLEHEVIPEIIARASQDEIRVWVAGCATGEEAYSIAMLFHEQLEKQGKQAQVKVFATDVHKTSLETAAAAIYDEDAVKEVSEQRRERYFKRDGEGYCVDADLRRLLVFAPHNVLKDSPFTKMDLIACRNLLIYFQPQAQQRALSLFHFGLKTGGILVLGPSETPGELLDEFETIDDHWKIFRKRRDVRLPTELRYPLPRALSQSPTLPRASAASAGRGLPDAALLGAYDWLLARHMPPAILINERHELLHVFGGAEKYLRVRAGRPTGDALDYFAGELRTTVLGAIKKVHRDNAPLRYNGVRVETPQGSESVRVVVEPIFNARAGVRQLLVAIEPMVETQLSAAEAIEDTHVRQMSRDRIETLEDELRFAKENLQATVEELETSNEELQATNEELVASNEELQSTNEELHSVNEELYTVNAEYQKKINDLTELTSDLDSLMESTDVATVFLDRDLCIRKFTPQIVPIFRLMPHDIGRSIDSFAHHLDRPSLIDDMRRVLHTGHPIEDEVQNRAGRWLFLRLLPYRSKKQIEGIVLTLIDIEALKRSQQSLALAVKQRDDFLAMLSHELRNPLSAVLSAVQLLDHAADDRAMVEQSLAVVKRQSLHMSRLLDDLLDISRMTRNKLELKRSKFDLRDAADAAIETVRPAVKRNGQSLITELPSEPLIVDGDYDRLRQVQVNLLANAVKFSARGAEIHHSLAAEDGWAVIRVRDHGDGIAPDMIDKIFQPFVQSRRTQPHSDGGMGVGLTLVRTLVDLHGGSVSAHSEGAGQGSLFEVRIPLADNAESTVAQSAGGQPEHGEEEAEMPTIRSIVVVEDQFDNRNLLVNLLRLSGYQVESAADGNEGLSLIERIRPDVAIIDVGLPERDGYAVARAARERMSEHPITLIALTGYGQRADVEKALAAGFDHHLVKPLQPEALRKLLGRPPRGAEAGYENKPG